VGPEPTISSAFPDHVERRAPRAAALAGVGVGVVGGLLGLGGAEFRLPILVGYFRYRIRRAISLNLAVSLVTVLATQAEGQTLVHDWLYELRLFALEQLSGMSADLFLCDPHRIIVTGPRKLRGRPLDSRDLRSGMALIAAGLAADGQSRLSPLETVERGYGRLVERLQGLGAKVAKMS
jgi:hypothetical protein